MAAGQLVDDELVESVVRDRLAMHDWNYGFVLDGFPRNARQAEFFLESYDIDGVINLHLPDEVVHERVLARRLCAGCGLDWNLLAHRPKVADICDMCGSALLARADDNPEALAIRLRDYHDKTNPVLELFQRKEFVATFDATQRDRRDPGGHPPSASVSTSQLTHRPCSQPCDVTVTPPLHDGGMTSTTTSTNPEQLSLLPDTAAVPLQFRLDDATRRRGLRHVAEIRARLERPSADERRTSTPSFGRVSRAPPAAQPALGASDACCLPERHVGVERHQRQRARRHAVVEVLLDPPRQASGDPWTTSSSTTSSGIAATAALRSPAAQASHIPCNWSPGPASGGTRRTPARSGRRRWRTWPPARTTSAFSLGQTKMRATISRSAPPAASSTTSATVRTSSGDNQLMIAPSASRPARRSMPSRSAATRIGGG